MREWFRHLGYVESHYKSMITCNLCFCHGMEILLIDCSNKAVNITTGRHTALHGAWDPGRRREFERLRSGPQADWRLFTGTACLGDRHSVPRPFPRWAQHACALLVFIARTYKRHRVCRTSCSGLSASVSAGTRTISDTRRPANSCVQKPCSTALS